jgi:uncharacterized delta-60 repeat protein
MNFGPCRMWLSRWLSQAAAFLSVLALGLGALVASVAQASPPHAVESSFGSGGEKFLEWSHESSTRPSQVLIDSAGGSLSFLTVNSIAGIPQSTIARLTASGSLDATFGSNGYTTAIADSFNFGGALQSDGKILLLVAQHDVSTGATSSLQLFRYQSNGQLDLTFGTNGVAVISASANRFWLDNFLDIDNGVTSTLTGRAAVRVQSTGRIIVAATNYLGWVGHLSGGQTVLTGLTSSGQIDQTFANNGSDEFQNTNGTYTMFADMAIDVSDRIVVLTTEYDTGVTSPWLFRFDSGGIMDVTFDGEPNEPEGNGRFQLLVGQNRVAGSVTALAGSKLLVTAMSGYEFSIAKYGPTGALDNIFATGGIKSFIPLGQLTSAPLSTLVQPDGKIVLGIGLYDKAVIARLLSTGNVDSSFGTNGLVEVGSSNGMATGVAIQSNGNLVVGYVDGSSSSSQMYTERAYVKRLAGSNGQVDTSFASSGAMQFSRTQLTGYNDDSQVRVSSQGSIFVVSEWRPKYRGASANSEALELVIYKINEGGELDISFGSGGMQRFNSFTYDWDLRGVAVDSSGGLAILLRSLNSQDVSYTDVMRVNADGTLNPDFQYGTVVSLLESSDVYPQSITFVAADSLVVMANFNNAGVLYKLLPDGSLDPSFDGDSGSSNGRVLINFDNGSEYVSCIGVDASSRLVLSGGLDTGAFVARVSASGVYDTTFNGSGVRRFSLASQSSNLLSEYCEAISIDPVTQKILVAGAMYSFAARTSNFLAQFNSDGTLDDSFDGNTGTANGLVLLAYSPTEDESSVVVIHRELDGVVVAFQRTSGTYFAAFKNDGSRNTTYSSTGVVNPSLNGWLRSFVKLPNGSWLGAMQRNFSDSTRADFIFKMSAAVAPTTTTTTPTSTAPPATTSTTVATPSGPVGAQTPVTAPQALKVRKGRRITLKSVATFGKLSLVSSSRVKASVSASSRKKCVVSGSYLKGLAAGNCVVRVTVSTTRGRRTTVRSKTVTVVVN